MADLPVTPDADRDPILVLKALFDAWTYSEESGGNVIVRSGWDIDEEIPAPSVILTEGGIIYQPGGADAVQDRIDSSIQIDTYARNEAEAASLMREVETVIASHRIEPGGIYAFLHPGNWINNDALNQAERLTRRTMTVTLIRHRGQ